MYRLPVADDGISVFKQRTGVDLVRHVTHFNRVAGIRVGTLSRIMAKNAKAYFLPCATVYRQWVMTVITGSRCDDIPGLGCADCLKE